MSERLMLDLLRKMQRESLRTLYECYKELYGWEVKAYSERIKLSQDLIDNINLTYREDIRG